MSLLLEKNILLHNQKRLISNYLKYDARHDSQSHLIFEMKSGSELLLSAIQAGVSRPRQNWKATLGLTFLAGAYVALGGFFAIRCGMAIPWDLWGSVGKLMFAMVFPLGLMLVVICGADLFTGNCMTLIAAKGHGRIGLFQVFRSGAYSWIGNFCGGAFVAYFMVYSSGMIFEVAGGSMPWADGIVKLANAKTHLSFWEAFLRGIGCNWLVCLAVYAAYAAKDVTGKILALWIPTMAFVAMGLEHCVANMFFIPLGIWTGTSDIYLAAVEAGLATNLTANWTLFLVDNLIPVTLGNIAGGAIMVTGIYSLIYGHQE